MTPKEILAHAIIDASIANTREHGGRFDYEYAKIPSNWEYGCYQSVLSWVDANIHFDTEFVITDVRSSDMPNDIFTTSMENNAPIGGPSVTFTPLGGVVIEETTEWNVTTGAGFSITETAEIGLEIPELGGAKSSTSVTFNGTLEVGRSSTHLEQEKKNGDNLLKFHHRKSVNL